MHNALQDKPLRRKRWSEPKPLVSWTDWAKSDQRKARMVAARAQLEEANPWVRKVHSMAVAERWYAKLRSVPPRPRPPRARPRDWREWAARQQRIMHGKLRKSRLSPWQKWASTKVVYATIQARYLRRRRRP